MSFRCAGPERQHHLLKAASQRKNLGKEFSLAVADCEYRAPLPPRLARCYYYNKDTSRIKGEKGIYNNCNSFYLKEHKKEAISGSCLKLCMAEARGFEPPRRHLDALADFESAPFSLLGTPPNTT